MANQPRPENRHRMVRVEDDLWEAARLACAKLGTTRAEVMRDALREAVVRADAGGLWPCPECHIPFGHGHKMDCSHRTIRP